MHRARTLWFIAALALSAAAPGCRDSAHAGVMAATGTDAHRLVAAGATLVDVRTAEEFADGHLSGAVNIPVADLQGRLAEIPANRPVVVYCASGARSARAGEILHAAGRTAVHDLGPMSAWDSR